MANELKLCIELRLTFRGCKMTTKAEKRRVIVYAWQSCGAWLTVDLYEFVSLQTLLSGERNVHPSMAVGRK